MRQPTGPQAAADELELLIESLDFALVPIALNTEKSFWACCPPHLGQINSTLAVRERTNFSYF
jgi:hypothetical protein